MTHDFKDTVRLIQLLIDKGSAELYSVNSYGQSSVHFAAYNNNVELLKYLLGNESDGKMKRGIF